MFKVQFFIFSFFINFWKMIEKDIFIYLFRDLQARVMSIVANKKKNIIWEESDNKSIIKE